jgi:beta-N-acetylhexosaminidase
MSLGPVMVDLAGTELTAPERELLLRPAVGGVILFTRNYSAPEQLRALVAEIHALRSPHLLVAVDQEGGRVQRFREPLTRLPPLQRLASLYDASPAEARRAAESWGWLMASELRALGVDLSFAPVLDLAHGLSGVIGDRAFHHDPQAVADLAQRYVVGMRRAGMAATGKHFPGHGGVRADSHLELPVDDRGLEDLRVHDLLSFERMISLGLPAVMSAHVVYPQVDALPATFSSVWLRRILREELGFQGVIFSDDLSMAGAAAQGDYAERARRAVEAGCDMVLVCNHPEGARAAVEALEAHQDPVAQVRLVRMHGRGGMDWEGRLDHPEWLAAAAVATRYLGPDERELNV